MFVPPPCLPPQQYPPLTSVPIQVVKSSPRHAVLQVPSDVGFVDSDDDCHKPTAILDVNVFGFLDPITNKFSVRPHSREFIMQLSRRYQLAVVSPCRGMTIQTGLFGLHYLLFVVEEGNLSQMITKHQLDGTNAVLVSTEAILSRYDMGGVRTIVAPPSSI